MCFIIVKTDSKNIDFMNLIKLLDDALTERYGSLQKKYEKHNKVDFIKDVVIVYKDDVPVACGAFKEYDTHSVELKRIFVLKEQRRRGLGNLVVNELEDKARNKGYRFALLETGIKQEEAINLYKKNGYEVIHNYEHYVGNDNSVCMRKNL